MDYGEPDGAWVEKGKAADYELFDNYYAHSDGLYYNLGDILIVEQVEGYTLVRTVYPVDTGDSNQEIANAYDFEWVKDWSASDAQIEEQTDKYADECTDKLGELTFSRTSSNKTSYDTISYTADKTYLTFFGSYAYNGTDGFNCGEYALGGKLYDNSELADLTAEELTAAYESYVPSAGLQGANFEGWNIKEPYYINRTLAAMQNGLGGVYSITGAAYATYDKQVAVASYYDAEGFLSEQVELYDAGTLWYDIKWDLQYLKAPKGYSASGWTCTESSSDSVYHFTFTTDEARVEDTTGGTDDNENAGGTDDNENAGGTDDNENAGGSGNNQNAGGSDNNQTAGGSDNNQTAGGSDNNQTAGGSDNNQTAGSTNSSQTAGSSNNSQTKTENGVTKLNDSAVTAAENLIKDAVKTAGQSADGTAETPKAKVDMADATVIPTDLLNAAKGQNVDVEFVMTGDDGKAYSWTINGNSFDGSADLKDVNLKVNKGTANVPSEVVQAAVGDQPTIQLNLADHGLFGFTANLHIYVGTEYAGQYANLYYYSDGNLIIQNSHPVEADGYTTLSFTHASDYVIAIGEQVEVPDANTNLSDSPKTGDTGNVGWFAVIFAVGCVAFAGAAYRRKRA
jgi:hypothetical protein